MYNVHITWCTRLSQFFQVSKIIQYSVLLYSATGIHQSLATCTFEFLITKLETENSCEKHQDIL